MPVEKKIHIIHQNNHDDFIRLVAGDCSPGNAGLHLGGCNRFTYKLGRIGTEEQTALLLGKSVYKNKIFEKDFLDYLKTDPSKGAVIIIPTDPISNSDSLDIEWLNAMLKDLSDIRSPIIIVPHYWHIKITGLDGKMQLAKPEEALRIKDHYLKTLRDYVATHAEAHSNLMFYSKPIDMNAPSSAQDLIKAVHQLLSHGTESPRDMSLLNFVMAASAKISVEPEKTKPISWAEGTDPLLGQPVTTTPIQQIVHSSSTGAAGGVGRSQSHP
ncbi:MAG: hypothetical protein K0R66_494 [Gammaproteobacteria bacterium]|nr:hypothetical protein [Gammaproteobacteria bacterium]